MICNTVMVINHMYNGCMGVLLLFMLQVPTDSLMLTFTIVNVAYYLVHLVFIVSYLVFNIYVKHYTHEVIEEKGKKRMD